MNLKPISVVLVVISALQTLALNDNVDQVNNGEDESISWPYLLKKFRSSVDSFLPAHSITRLYRISDKLNASSACKNSIIESLLALRKLEGWAVQMADASGKLPSGVLDGTIMDLGSFEECLKIRNYDSDGKEEFRGRHCMVGYKSPMLSQIDKKTPEGANYADVFGKPPDWVSHVLKKTGAYLTHAAFWFGTCVPSTCSAEDIKQIATYVSKPLKMNVLMAGCKTDEPEVWSKSATISVYILSCFIGLCCLGTVLDAVLRHFTENYQNSVSDYLLFRILKAFSVLSNTEKLFASDNNNRDVLSCFHGIRFLSATWIILGHTYFFTDTWKFLKYRNGLGVDDRFKNYLPVAVMENFSVPVGSFFFMSGFLLVYVSWKKLESNKGKINLIMFFVHKYWRMTPALGLMITMLLALPIVSSGPLWISTLEAPIQACKRHWWTHLLFINNFWPSEDYCLVHTWYLAALMQFHLIGVCLLMLSHRLPFLGIILGVVLAIGSCTGTALLMMWNNFPMPAPGINKDIETMEEYNTKIYIKPFSHSTSYLIGMIVAAFFVKYKQHKIRTSYQLFGWVAATASALFSVYGLYLPSDKVEVRAFYISVHRAAWATGVGWLVYACITGHGGIINRMLSWKAFVPLGHLSYLVYLLHPVIMLYRTASLRERLNYGHTEMVFEFFNYTVVSFFLAFIGHVTVEKPFLILDGIFFKQNSSCNLASKAGASEEAPKCIKTVYP